MGVDTLAVKTKTIEIRCESNGQDLEEKADDIYENGQTVAEGVSRGSEQGRMERHCKEEASDNYGY